MHWPFIWPPSLPRQRLLSSIVSIAQRQLTVRPSAHSALYTFIVGLTVTKARSYARRLRELYSGTVNGQNPSAPKQFYSSANQVAQDLRDPSRNQPWIFMKTTQLGSLPPLHIRRLFCCHKTTTKKWRKEEEHRRVQEQSWPSQSLYDRRASERAKDCFSFATLAAAAAFKASMACLNKTRLQSQVPSMTYYS